MPNHPKPEFTPIEKKLIYALGGDLDHGRRPFAELGRRLGLSEIEVMDTIGRLRDRGCLRRFGATLRHQRSGFTANAMVAWRVNRGDIEAVGRKLAAFPEVTHCYQRRTVPGWDRNLYTMIHAASEEDCHELARRMAESVGVTDYELLFSHEELKKTSMRYFG